MKYVQANLLIQIRIALSIASSEDIQRINDITGYKYKEFPMTYLGCPLYAGRKRISFFNDMITKIVRKTSANKFRHLFLLLKLLLLDGLNQLQIGLSLTQMVVGMEKGIWDQGESLEILMVF